MFMHPNDVRVDFATAGRVLLGRGTFREAGRLAASLGSRALVVTGSSIERTEPLMEMLAAEGMAVQRFMVEGEPTTDAVRACLSLAVRSRCDCVVGFGGGSVLDTGKAVAALLTNGGDPLEYLEVIGGGKPLTQASAPYLAIPTTAGTGTEVTRNAVLASTEHRVKASLRSPGMLPSIALVDPDLTLTVPPEVTASTGIDALTQLIEPYVTPRGNPLTDAICREGMVRAARSLRQAYQHGTDCDAREDLAVASLFGGLALANAGLGAVHGFAGPIGGMYTAPHGALCAALLPHVMAVNLRALRARDPIGPGIFRYRDVAQVLTGNIESTADEGAVWVSELCTDLRVAPLRAHGVTLADLNMIVEKASAASSMKANPISLTQDEMHEILERAL